MTIKHQIACSEHKADKDKLRDIMNWFVYGWEYKRINRIEQIRFRVLAAMMEGIAAIGKFV